MILKRVGNAIQLHIAKTAAKRSAKIFINEMKRVANEPEHQTSRGSDIYDKKKMVLR